MSKTLDILSDTEIDEDSIGETIVKAPEGYKVISSTGKHLGTYPTRGQAKTKQRFLRFNRWMNSPLPLSKKK